MRAAIISIFLSGISLFANAQVSLNECQHAARENYPLIRQYNLIYQSEGYTLSNVKRGNLPHVSINGKVSYQSEATTFPFELPGIETKGLPKEQYLIMMEVNQNVWDGGVIRNRKKQTEALTAESKKQVDVSMYALRERVNQIFFSILLLDEQLKQNDILNEQLNRNLKDIENYKTNGLANDTDIDAVKVELLKSKQNRSHLISSRTAFINMLSLLIGKELKENETFIRPKYIPASNGLEMNRPELLLYEARKYSLMTDLNGLKAGYMPRLSLFAQGGFGNPGLDMLKDEFRPFYVIGARLTWNFGNLYTLKSNKKHIDNRMQQIDTEQELFIFNTRMKMKEQEGYLRTLEKQMKDDEEIIRLRTNIRKSAEAKVANGTMSVTDMLREVTEENLAMQTKVVHEIELLMQLYQMKHLTN